jgi:hypothetical protein
MCGSGYIDAKRRQFLRVDVSKTAESLIRYLTVMSSPRPSPLDFDLEREAQESADHVMSARMPSRSNDGTIATMPMMSAAIRHSRPSRMPRPRLAR